MINLSDYKKIHCIGIGGIGLSAIAEVLLHRGYIVSGSDMKESEMITKLRSSGIEVFIGHKAENISDVDMLVYSAAVSMENPEIIKAKELGIPMYTRAEVLGALMDDYENSIAISGTHGKTTTTSMVSLILKDALLEPTILVGGNLSEIDGNVSVGNSEYFVTEACEYMDSFLSLRPKIEVILNIDSDHLDYFKDIDHIVRSFDKFTDLIPENGKIIAYDANPFVKKVISNVTNAITFGYNENCTYEIKNIKFSNAGTSQFNVCYLGKELANISLNIPGEHNILNAVAALACCHQLGVDIQVIKKTLERFDGTERRFDIVGKKDNNILVVDDYAHHPTEIQATLLAAKNIEHEKLVCVFQPHTYTRTIALFDEFSEAFQDADVLILAEIYAAREKNIYKISSKSLAEKIKEKHPEKEVVFLDDFNKIVTYLNDNTKENDLVITMGAGDIYKVGELFFEA